jgi:hypothetical protein
MTRLLEKPDGEDFRSQDGKTGERPFAIIAFVIGRTSSGQYGKNRVV